MLECILQHLYYSVEYNTQNLHSAHFIVISNHRVSWLNGTEYCGIITEHILISLR